MFVKYNLEFISVLPVVWVRDIDTFFFETSCGSGSASVGVLNSTLKCKSLSNLILQPSSNIIKVDVKYDMKVIDVVISGSVTTDGIVYELDID